MPRSHPSELGNVAGEWARNLLVLAIGLVVLGMAVKLIIWIGGY